MNKDLIIRILGKEDAVKFDDEMFNLRPILEDLRYAIILQLPLDEEAAHNTKEKLMMTSISMKLLLKNIEGVMGYTNSKNYLKNFLEKICLHIEEICSSINENSCKDLTYHTNCLADLVLSY